MITHCHHQATSLCYIYYDPTLSPLSCISLLYYDHTVNLVSTQLHLFVMPQSQWSIVNTPSHISFCYGSESSHFCYTMYNMILFWALSPVLRHRHTHTHTPTHTHTHTHTHRHTHTHTNTPCSQLGCCEHSATFLCFYICYIYVCVCHSVS